jgi:hypothetical protein
MRQSAINRLEVILLCSDLAGFAVCCLLVARQSMFSGWWEVVMWECFCFGTTDGHLTMDGRQAIDARIEQFRNV